MHENISVRVRRAVRIGIFAQLFFLATAGAAAEDRPLLVMLSAQDLGTPSGYDVVQAHLVDLPVTLTIEMQNPSIETRSIHWRLWAEQVASRTGAEIVFWVDPIEPDQLWLHVQGASGPKLITRHIGSPDNPANRFESMATIVRAEARTLLETKQQQTGPSPPPPSGLPVIPARQVSSPPPSPARIGIGLSYGMALQSSDQLMAHSIRAGITGYFTDQASLLVGYRIQLPTRIEHPNLVLEVTSHPIELGSAVRWRRGPNQLHMGLVALVDWMSWRVDPRTEQVAPSADQWNLRVALSPSVGYSRQLTGRFHLFVAVSLDVFLYQRSLTVVVDNATEVLFKPWTASPYFQVGLLLDI